MQNAKVNRSPFKLKFPYLFILLGFLAIILVGALLLMLPISTHNGVAFIDALFVSTSAVCITGLSSVVLIDTFTGFGQTVIMLLIQIGGLGFVTVMTAVLTLFGVKLGLQEKFLMGETLGESRLNVRTFLLRALLITFTIEALGVILKIIALRNDYSGGRLVFVSLFQAVSAFNNAGFDLFGSTSMVKYAGDANPLLLTSTALLTVLGGLGYIVINEVVTLRKSPRNLSTHCKIVLAVTPILLLGGGLGIYLSEWGNVSFGDAMFMSAMARTCGFSVCDLSTWKNSSLMLYDFLMFVGAGPASTGGGIKCTTLVVIVVAIVSFMRGKQPVVFQRKIPKATVSRAMLITVMTLICVFSVSTGVAAIEPQTPTSHIVLETVSAFANVGSSAGITTSLQTGSKALLILAMFFGRLGCMTVLMVLRRNWNRGEDEAIRYVDAEIIVG